MSVALCTYDGARHIQAYLESLVSQTRIPDELVICDDRSQDKTIEVVRSFTSKVPFSVRFTINQHNLGTTKNFERAIGLCRGNIIVLADQDDICRKDKLLQIERAFSASSKAGIVFSDAEMVDEDLEPLGYSLWQSLKFTASEQRHVIKGNAIDVLLKHNVVAGATLAFRAEFRDLILPIPPDWMHDGWIALVLAAFSDFSILPEPLVKYRQHSRNQIGAMKKTFVEQLTRAQRQEFSIYATYYHQLVALKKRLLKYGNSSHDKIVFKIEAKMNHLLARDNMPENRFNRLPRVIRELVTLRYYRYSNGAHSVAKDLFLSTKR